MKAFADLEHTLRYQVVRAVDAAGGHIWGYVDNGAGVHLPTDPDGERRIDEAFAAVGFERKAARIEGAQRTEWYFPLGTDRPPDSMRHGSFWKCAHFGPMA